MDSFLKQTLAATLLLAVGAGVGYYAAPSKIKIVEHTVVKTVREKQVDRVTKTVTRPDGSAVTTVVDKSKIDTVSDRRTDKEKIVERKKLDWQVGGGVLLDLQENKRSYFGYINRRIIGTISVGLFGTSGGSAGLGISIQF